MSTFSCPGSADPATEADTLRGLITENAVALRTIRLGQRCELDRASFRLHASGRNTIYRVSGRHQWFLKLPRNGEVDPVVHERIGAETALQVLGSNPRYGGPGVIRVSIDPPFVLAAAIPGTPLNAVFFTSCWMPGARTGRRLEEAFRTLGSLLAELHLHGHPGPGTPAATTRPFDRVGRLLAKADSADRVTRAIRRWHESCRQSDTGTTFIHGNMRMDNVLRTGSRLGFIDFENCGSGSLYQDLSRPISQLLLTRSLIMFPSALADRCVRAMTEAYAELHPYDSDRLWAFIGARQARHYLEACAKGRFEDRVGGLPTIRRKLAALTLSVIRDGFEQVLPEIAR